jgi:hypothetical protein
MQEVAAQKVIDLTQTKNQEVDAALQSLDEIRTRKAVEVRNDDKKEAVTLRSLKLN